jgi:hypothetical protein
MRFEDIIALASVEDIGRVIVELSMLTAEEEAS